MKLDSIHKNTYKPETLYHKDIGFPSNLTLPKTFNNVTRVRYSQHAKDEASHDRYGDITLPNIIDFRKGETIEIGVRDKEITKIVIRFPHDKEKDIVMVVNPSDGFVRTVWFNMKNDTHNTLDKSKYARP